LVDGAILNPVPSDIAAEMGADLVIAVRLGGRPVARAVEAEARAGSGRLPSILKTIMESLELMQTKMGYQTAAAATIAIEPTFAEVGSVGLHQFSEGRRYIPLGEAAAEAALPRISAVLPWLQPG
jgi:NTE family protein